MINILGICDNKDIIEILGLIRFVINMIKVLVPIILIVTTMIQYVGAVSNPDQMAKVNKSFVSKIVAAVLIFLIPTLVAAVIKLVDPNSETVLGCMRTATIGNAAIIENLNL